MLDNGSRNKFAHVYMYTYMYIALSVLNLTTTNKTQVKGNTLEV